MSQQQDVSATGPCLLSYRISETVQQLELGHMTCYPSLSPLLLSQLSPVSWTTTINKTLFYPSHKTQSLHIPGEDTLKRYHLAFFLPLPSQKRPVILISRSRRICQSWILGRRVLDPSQRLEYMVRSLRF